MKFFKLVEITEEEYIERTRDIEFEYFTQTVNRANKVYPEDNNIYIATDENEYEIRIDREYFSNEDYEDEDYE